MPSQFIYSMCMYVSMYESGGYFNGARASMIVLAAALAERMHPSKLDSVKASPARITAAGGVDEWPSLHISVCDAAAGAAPRCADAAISDASSDAPLSITMEECSEGKALLTCECSHLCK